MKLVLNERYDILLYVFHTYFWFMSLIEDGKATRLWGTLYPSGVHLMIRSFVPRLWGTLELHEFDIVINFSDYIIF